MTGDEPLRARDLVIAGCVTLAIVTGALLSDPGVRANIERSLACRPIAVHIESGYGEPFLRVPLSGLNASASAKGLPISATYVVHVREDPAGSWREHSRHMSDTGKFVFVVSPTTEQTEAYVHAIPDDPSYCEGDSGILRGSSNSPVTVPTDPTPGDRTSADPTLGGAPVPDPIRCEAVELHVTNGFGESWLRMPVSAINATVTGLPAGSEIRAVLYVGNSTRSPMIVNERQSPDASMQFVIQVEADTIAFVHVEFPSASDCVKDSPVLRAATS